MDKMDDGFSISLETVILFIGILFIAFCCGFLRSLRRVFAANRDRHPLPQRNILVAHVRIPSAQTTTVQLQNDADVSSVFPAEEQLSPPPYSAVSNILPPPSYDEAIKISGNTPSENAAPKTDDRY